MTKKTFIIIGTSAAALGAATRLRLLDAKAVITCISDEIEFPYNKCFLADYLSGIKEEAAVYTKPQHFFKENNIQLLLGKKVISLDRQKKIITLADGQSLPYDALFLGTGSSPFVPDIIKKNNAMQGLYTFHTLADSHAILAYVHEHNVARVLIIGGGLSSLECADALQARGLHVTIIIRNEHLLKRCINKPARILLESKMRERGITLIKHNEIQEVMYHENKIHGVRLTDGQELNADLLIAATGLQPNVQLAHQAGLQLNNGFIAVNEYMQTSDTSIWAGGDCCMVRDQLTNMLVPSTTWPDAMLQGSIAAQAMAGKPKKYGGLCAQTSSSFFGLNLVTAGIVLVPEAQDEVVEHAGADYYHRLVVRDGKLRGFLLLGHTGRAAVLRRALLTGDKGFLNE